MRGRSNRLINVFFQREAALVITLTVLFVAFSAFTPGFLDWFNLFERSRFWVVPGMIAVPMTFIITTAGIDLSVGAIVALCGIVLGLLHQNMHVSIVWASAAAVLVGVFAGSVNGFVSSYLKIPPLVVTLATMALFGGVAIGLSEGQPIRNFPQGFLWLSQGDVFQIPIGGSPAFFPVPLLGLLVTVVVGGVILRFTWFGRFAECIGENTVAAEFAAIDVRWIKFIIYSSSGFVCGIASLLYTAQYATARPDAARGMELEAIACVVIGGTRISGGQGSILGTLLGLLIIGILRYGLEMSGVKSEYLIIVIGGLLILMAVFNERMASAAGGRK